MRISKRWRPEEDSALGYSHRPKPRSQSHIRFKRVKQEVHLLSSSVRPKSRGLE